LYALGGSAIFAAFMAGLIRNIAAGFLMLVIVFAAFSSDIVLMYEKSVNKEDIALAADAGMEKKASEIKELLPEKEFINNSGYEELLGGDRFEKAFCAFRQSYVHPHPGSTPTPPPRAAA